MAVEEMFMLSHVAHRITATSGHHPPSVNPRKWNGGGYKYLCQTGTVIG